MPTAASHLAVAAPRPPAWGTDGSLRPDIRRFWHAVEARDWEAAGNCLTEDFEAVWPQTRERFRGRDVYIRLNAEYPGNWHVRLEETVVEGERAVARVTITDGPAVFYASDFYHLRDGRLAHALEYFAEPGAPPYDRSALAGRW